jgi:hypothetical protein
MTVDFISFVMGWISAAILFATLFETVFGELRDEE